jgi:hypothetical protein
LPQRDGQAGQRPHHDPHNTLNARQVGIRVRCAIRSEAGLAQHLAAVQANPVGGFGEQPQPDQRRRVQRSRLEHGLRPGQLQLGHGPDRPLAHDEHGEHIGEDLG